MARDQSGGATPSPEERAAGERAGRKHLGEDGRPQTPLTADAQDAANRDDGDREAGADPAPRRGWPGRG